MQDQTGMKLGHSVLMQEPFDQAIEAVTAALKEEGFGVLTEIDVQQTLKQKLDVDFRKYRILGACNPTLAHRALSEAPHVGLLLPCNVTVAEAEDGQVEVSLVDPLMMLSLVDHPVLRQVAQEAGAKLERVARNLGARKG